MTGDTYFTRDGKVTFFCAAYISSDVPTIKALKQIDDGNAFVLHWKAADVFIPWPEGMTPKQAILAWAKAQS